MADSTGLQDIRPSRRKARRSEALISTQIGRAKIGSIRYLLGQVFKMLLDQVVAPWVEQYRKAPRVTEGNQVGLSGVEIDIHDAIVCDSVSRQLRPVNAQPLLWIENYANCEPGARRRGPGVAAH